MQHVSHIWLDAPAPSEELSLRLAEVYGLPAAVARVMARLGLEDDEAVDRFLEPRLERLGDPLILPDMPKAVERIWTAIRSGERILVFGDYDVDGVTSTTFLSRVLEGLGADVRRFIPHRIEDGYGLGADTVRHCLDEHRPGLIVTVDCGTGSVEAVEMARAEGVDVIVTDHHEPSGGVAKPHALVNPKMDETLGDVRNLAGVGVAFKLCHGLIKVGRQMNYTSSFNVDMRPLMYLVALGTVADMVPMVGENRILARFGIEVLNKRPDPGIDALARNAGIQQEMSSYHIGFVLGPRINAAGRMDSPDIALQTLLSTSPREADRLARMLEEANKKRQAIEETIRHEAEEHLLEHHDPTVPGVIVVADRGWHSGVVGIVASRLVRRHHRPAIVISIGEDGIGRGSCRSIEGFDLITQLESVDRYLRQYGGHRMAAGLDIREEDIPAFREAINARAREVMADMDLRPRQIIDGWITLDDLSDEFLNAQDRLMPFGHHNPIPVWAVRNLHIEKFQKVGRDKKHLRMLFRTPSGMQDAIGFGLGGRGIPEGPVDIAFQLRRNVFRGEERLQLMIQDLRPSGDSQ